MDLTASIQDPVFLRRLSVSDQLIISTKAATDRSATVRGRQTKHGQKKILLMANTKSPTRAGAVLLAFSLLLGVTVSFGGSDTQNPEQQAVVLQVPFNLAHGQQKYLRMCTECHGEWGRGTDQGPPLLHDYYKPSHHSDQSFLRAILRGSPQHHWNFGDMPPVDGATVEDARQVIGYVRWLQLAENLY